MELPADGGLNAIIVLPLLVSAIYRGLQFKGAAGARARFVTNLGRSASRRK